MDHRSRRLSAALLLVAALVACNGGDDPAKSTTTPSSTVSLLTTEAPSASSAPAQPMSSSAPAPAAPPTTMSPTTTTNPPPTMIDPFDDLAGTIQRDLTAGNEMLAEVLADPMAPYAAERLEHHFSGQALGFLVDLVQSRREDDLTVEPNPDVPATIQLVDDPELVPGSDPPTAEVTVCQIDSGILMAPVNDSDVRIPINDDVLRVVARVTVELADGVWRMRNGGTGDEQIGVTSCD